MHSQTPPIFSSADRVLQSIRLLQQQQASAQRQQIALQQQQISFQQQQTIFQQEQTNYRQEQIAWQQQQTAYMTQLLSRTHQNGGPVTISSHDHRDESTSNRRPTLVVAPPSSINTKGQAVANIATKRTWIGIGWYHYRSRIQAKDSHAYPPSNNLTSQGNDDDKDIEISYYPGSWFSSRGFSFGAARTWGAWTYSLRPVRVVPRTSTVFYHAGNGNTSQIIKLLDNHEATLYDTDEDGRNLLHVGIPFQSRFSQLLLSEHRLRTSNDLSSFGSDTD